MFPVLKQFVKFLGVGSVSAIGHYGLLIGLVSGFGFDPVLSSAAGAFVGALINYALNYRFTFKSSQQHSETVSRFALIALLGLGLNTFLMWLGVDVLALHYLLAQILTTMLVIIWSFAGNRLWTFRPSSEKQ